jgi:peroxiredoxin Q/BCP
MIEVGQDAPPFRANDREGNPHGLEDYRGRWVVLYFYPKDNTPGCTIEAIDFTAQKADFEAMGAVVLGVSPDSEKSVPGRRRACTAGPSWES